jgi:hypothetical protein
MLFLIVAPAMAFKPPSPLTRRQAVLRGVPAAAAALSVVSPTPALADKEPFTGDFAKQGIPGGRMFELSSGGISSYQKLQLENGLAELAKPASTATGQVKDALDAFLSYATQGSNSSLAD